jgi:phage terminase small subunit
MALTDKEQRFVEEYLIDLNATQAAIRAGYSPKTARQIACENLTKPHIQDAVTLAMQERSERTKIDADRVLAEYALIGLSDIRHYQITASGALSLVDGAPDYAARAVASVKQKYFYDEDGNPTGGETEIKLWPKVSALDSIARHLGMFIDRHRISGPDGGDLHVKHSADGQILDLLSSLSARLERPGK